MDWITRLNLRLNTWLADPVVLQWTFFFGLGLLVFLLFLLLGRQIQRRFDPVKGRIETFAVEASLTSEQRLTLDKEARGQRLVERLGRGLAPSDSVKGSKTTDKLARMGFRTQRDIQTFYGFKILVALGLPLMATLVMVMVLGRPMQSVLPIAAIALPLGWIAPDYWLTKKFQKRQAALRRALPDALDMLVVCTEAGLGLNAGIQRIALEMDIQHPELADELKTTMLHMGAGMDTRTALQELSKRTDLEEMRSLVSTLHQAMRYGTSVAETLRAYAEEMRNKRLEAAQEQAAKVGVKMLIPIALFMLPSVMLVVMGPPMIKLLASLGGQ